MKDYYKILGVTTTSSQADIKKAYRLLAVKYHPDKNNGDKVSEERFKEISESYIILGDAAKRNAYDYTKGYQDRYRSSGTAKQTPVTFLILFKRIKEKVIHANGRINQNALFKVIDDLLSDETITFLITVQDTATNNLITDDILTCCVFLDETLRSGIYAKLLKLADGDLRFTEKMVLLNKKTETVSRDKNNIKITENQDEFPAKIMLLIFVLFIILFLIIVWA